MFIPHNEDPKPVIDSVDADFWKKVHQWEDKGWGIPHGYNHCYSSDGGLKGLNPMWCRNGFAGLRLEEQRTKIGKVLWLYSNIVFSQSISLHHVARLTNIP